MCVSTLSLTVRAPQKMKRSAVIVPDTDDESGDSSVEVTDVVVNKKQRVEVPEGLVYFANVVPEELSRRICTWAVSPEMVAARTRVSSSPTARQVLQFGFVYDYVHGAGVATTPIPPLLCELRDVLESRALTFSSDDFNQVIVNFYEPGQGIGAHVDSRAYGSTIACFTFGGGREMEFSRTITAPYCLYTEPNSLYTMSGPARYEWRHQMRPRLRDGADRPRTLCFSVTFRMVSST